MIMGSLPRPQRIRDLIQDRNAGHISGAYAERLLDDVVPLAIRMQEWAGLDFLSDGERRRTSYVTVFTEAVDGFEPDLVPRAGACGAPSILPQPSRRARISWRR